MVEVSKTKSMNKYLGSKTFYGIPRACLLNRSPVPAMVLKSNRSGLLWF